MRDCVSAVRPHHETNDGDEGGMRKGNDDETEGETKAEYERTAENGARTRERKGRKKGGEGIAENRVEAGKELAVMVVATSLGNGRWLKNEVIW